MSKLLIINLSGGLGNQLFQFWAGRQIAESTGCNVVYDPTNLKSHSTPRELILSEFAVANSLLLIKRNTTRTKTLLNRVNTSILLRSPKYRNFVSFLFRHHYSTEIGFEFPAAYYGRFKRISGHFQSYSYTTGFESKILEEMTLVKPTPLFLDLAEEILMEKPIVMHVRGGDYKNLKDSFGMLSINFFEEAVEILTHEYGKQKIWLFSDDLERARYFSANLSSSIDRMICDNKLTSAETLKLMSMGKFLVISNSTYSWWAGRISSAEKIIAPNKWFKGINDPKSIYPPNWQTIESSWVVSSEE